MSACSQDSRSDFFGLLSNFAGLKEKLKAHAGVFPPDQATRCMEQTLGLRSFNTPSGAMQRV
jgi:hypothetical protein